MMKIFQLVNNQIYIYFKANAMFSEFLRTMQNVKKRCMVNKLAESAKVKKK